MILDTIKRMKKQRYSIGEIKEEILNMYHLDLSIEYVKKLIDKY